MVEAEELIVAIRSEGVGETQEDLEGVEESMEETADSAGDSAEELEGFSERFQGAMSAAVAALAVGAAGLLSQVPVLGELFSGLAAVVSALAFQMDGVLRPVLSPLTDFFFELSAAIFEADGILGDLIGAISSVGAAVAVAVPLIAKAGALLGVWASTGAGVVSILGTIAGAIATLAGAIVSLPAVLVGAVAALVAFVAAYLTNWNGIRDKTNAIIGEIIGTVTDGFGTLVSDALAAVSAFASDVVAAFTDLASDLGEWASGVASDAVAWGKSLIQGFISGIQAALSRLREFLTDLRDIGATVGIDVPDLGGLGGGGGGGGTGTTGRPRDRRGGAGGVTLDGRSLTESTGRYRSDGPRRRGI